MRTLTDEQISDMSYFVQDKLDDPNHPGCTGNPDLICEWLEENIVPEKHKEILDELFDRNVICDCDLGYRNLYERKRF